MRPILLKGHERPLTFLKYNAEGDLLVTCAKDHTPNLWYSDDGERIGTYSGHNGAVWTADLTADSLTMVTASADTTAKLWDVPTGKNYFTFDFDRQGARGCSFSIGGGQVVITVDPFMGTGSSIRVFKMFEDRAEQKQEVLQEFVGHEGRITRAVWGALNRTIISAGEDGTVRLWDVETGKQLAESRDHKKQVNDLTLSADATHFVTGSLDKTAKIFDSTTLECLKTFQPERPVNAAVLSPIFDHVIVGGGQDAMSVTLTSSKAGKFESKIYQKVFGEEIGGIKGHFGPINALAISPDGRSFSSGGEDGFVRIHHFDADYFRLKL